LAVGLGAAAAIGRSVSETRRVAFGESTILAVSVLLASLLPEAWTVASAVALAAYVCSRLLRQSPNQQRSLEAHLLPWLVMLAACAHSPSLLGSPRIIGEAFIVSLLAGADRTPTRWLAAGLALVPMLNG